MADNLGWTSTASAMVDLGLFLGDCGYHFVAVTPETHRRVNSRAGNAEAKTLRDIFGWSRPFKPTAVPPHLLHLMAQADVLLKQGDMLKSAVRFATHQATPYLHCAYPTLQADSVFFGPDSYRFVDLIRRQTRRTTPNPRIVDIGCGSGIGGIVASQAFERADVVLADINPKAILFSDVNARIANVRDYTCVQSDVFSAVKGDVDLIVSNPPYMRDDAARAYRHGGDNYGCDLSVRILRESIQRLAPEGQLILYTGSAFVEGQDLFRKAAEPLLLSAGFEYRYEEIDPDVFGEELDLPAYANVERIAAVGLVAFAPPFNSR